MSKDWTGNIKSTFSTLGASSHSQHDREKNDYYATDPQCAKDLINLGFDITHVWEPACGEGHLAKVFSDNGIQVLATDLHDRGYGISGVDFLRIKPLDLSDVWIITNPPYKYALEFCLHALKFTPLVAMFLKLQFLEGQRRYKELFMNMPPNYVYVYTKRQKCGLNGVFRGSSAVAYCWYIWNKDTNDKPLIKWI